MANTLADITAKVMPKSGGTMTGAITLRKGDNSIVAPTDDYYIEIEGGTKYGNGAKLTLYGQDCANHQGLFSLSSISGDTKNHLVGKPDGTLTWVGKNIVRSVNGTNADASGNVNVSTSTRFLFDSSTVVATLSGKGTSKSKTVALEAGRLYFYCAGCNDTNDSITLSVKSGGFAIADGASLGKLSGYTYQTDSGIFLATESTVVFTYSSTTSSGGVKFYEFNH